MKELRPDPMNMIFPSVLCGGLSAVLLWGCVAHGFTVASLKSAAVILVLFVGLTILVMGHRLFLSEKEIISWSLFRTRKIDVSLIFISQLSVSKINPITLTVFDRKPNDRTKPLATIPLNPFKRADIMWLLEQPQIKIDH
jgi:hypothetical protein